MIAPLLAAGLALQAPLPPRPDPFAPPPFLTMTFEEALRPPKLQLTCPRPLAVDLRPSPGLTAGQAWLRFALGVLAQDSFERWEQDPEGARRGRALRPDRPLLRP